MAHFLLTSQMDHVCIYFINCHCFLKLFLSSSRFFFYFTDVLIVFNTCFYSLYRWAIFVLILEMGHVFFILQMGHDFFFDGPYFIDSSNRLCFNLSHRLTNFCYWFHRWHMFLLIALINLFFN